MKPLYQFLSFSGGMVLLAAGAIKTMDFGVDMGKPVSIQTRDLNGDGINDLIIRGSRNWSPDNYSIFIADTNGSYISWDNYKSNKLVEANSEINQLESDLQKLGSEIKSSWRRK